MTLIKRNVLRDLIQQWDSGKIDEREVHEKAEALCEQYECRDLPNSHPDSIPVEVLSQLEILNHQLIIIGDIPEILQFLETPSGMENDGWSKWQKYWKNVDYESRKTELRSNDYYFT